MVTKQPEGSGSARDPWGRRDQGHRAAEQGPPDLSTLWSQLTKKISGHQIGSGNSPDHGKSLMKRFGFIMALLGVLWGLCGFYTIHEIERGVVTRLGRFSQVVPPGLNWRAIFIDRVQRVDIGSVRGLSATGSMLTQDENMVQVEMNVQYKVVDPVKYLFSVTNADHSLQQATDSALRYVVGHTTMDNVLTRGRAKVRSDTKEFLNQITAAYDMGLELTDVNFQQARPPEKVKDAFDDAISAQEDQQRFIREAEAYARAREPEARGEAKRLEEEAQAYKEAVMLRAKGEVARFTQLLPHYLKSPQITRERLYIESIERVLIKTRKVLLGNSTSNQLMVLPLEQLMKNVQPDPLPETPHPEKSVSMGPTASTTPMAASAPIIRQGSNRMHPEIRTQ
jgi:modulator of FtsH protease HflK